MSIYRKTETTKIANYINNKKMLEEFVKHRARVQKAKDEGKELPQLPDYLGLCFMQIAERLGTKGNFAGYSWLDEMKADGIENCIIGAHNFDPEKGDNPFAYFTKIIWFAFLRRIEKEKKQSYVKYKVMQNMNITGEHVEGDASGFQGINLSVENVAMNNVVSAFEDKKKKKDEKIKATKKKKGVEAFFESEDTPVVESEEIQEPESILDAETRAQLGMARIGENLGSIGTKNPNGLKFRGN